jgi:hypothetical protein
VSDELVRASGAIGDDGAALVFHFINHRPGRGVVWDTQTANKNNLRSVTNNGFIKIKNNLKK